MSRYFVYSSEKGLTRLDPLVKCRKYEHAPEHGFDAWLLVGQRCFDHETMGPAIVSDDLKYLGSRDEVEKRIVR